MRVTLAGSHGDALAGGPTVRYRVPEYVPLPVRVMLEPTNRGERRGSHGERLARLVDEGDVLRLRVDRDRLVAQRARVEDHQRAEGDQQALPRIEVVGDRTGVGACREEGEVAAHDVHHHELAL